MGNSHDAGGRAAIHAFYTSKAWIEGSATKQLEHVAAMSGIRALAAMPDLHPGKYGPVGCAILADAVRPAFVGSDIGCGMGLYRLEIAARKVAVDKAAVRLRVLGDAWDGDIAAALADGGLVASDFDASLGSVGGGNHFVELQAVENILLPEVASAAGLQKDDTYVLVHSGSRGLGMAVLEAHLTQGLSALPTNSDDAARYRASHDHAVRWAALNRRILAERAGLALRTKASLIVDQPHNFAEWRDDGVLHRKGAAPADRGLVPVPGSRGTLSYLVQPLADAPATSLATLAHGAGRKYDRASMIGRAGTTRSDRERLARNPFGGVVICEDKALAIEEAPEAYKSIGHVIEDLVAFGLARVVATFRPLVTFKKAVAAEATREHRRDRANDRERLKRQRRQNREDRR